MRYNEIYETPISDMSVINPDADERVSPMTYKDYGAMTSPKGRIKILKAFEKTSYNFNLYVINNRDNIRTKEYLEKALNKSIDFNNHITMVYCNNTSKDRRVLNSWMLAHRMAHFIQSSRSCIPLVIKLHQKFANLFNPKQIEFGVVDLPRIYLLIASCIIDTKACRSEEKLLSTVLDIAGELIAQYLILGKIKLRPMTLERYKQVLVLDRHYNHQILKEHEINEINSKISTYSKEFYNIITEIFENLVGDVLWF